MLIRKFFFMAFISLNSSLMLSQPAPVRIALKSGSSMLDAKFFPSVTGKPAPAVILLHGFPGNQASPLDLAEKLNDDGFNVLVFNYEGSYASEGNFSFGNCMSNVDAAVDFLHGSEVRKKYKVDTARIVVCGYSFGGNMALLSAIYNTKIRNIIAVANDDNSVGIRRAIADTEYQKGFKQFISRSFGPEGPFRGDIESVFKYNAENVDRLDLVKNADRLAGRNIMFIVGWLDLTCPVEIKTLPLFRKLNDLKSPNVSITGFACDHRFPDVRESVADTIAGWIRKL